ncbi:hypothetical protein BO82DRAFT_413837 [Aspergillus uvarum CBS 121591]|uniref:Uncharacterized protein n=1 Tax=Aspergillus uvarum CBS 121591 TaxID=1448315 RepID=A0A319CAN4_9EURO|nr:hypothetical protein BO82DRAFT_413837 [Aspergillus uvarum CBS 121591]PYH82545.1 hypothetical protein BO82DRAFT_413837 [Aspergillus uvarum CBS 121591]
MVSHFSDQIKPPIVGVAHSFRCSQFVRLSIMHPRLFSSLISLEPMIQVEGPSILGGRSPALWASTRPDLWSSSHEGEEYIRSNPFWRRWDSRAVDKYTIWPSCSPNGSLSTQRPRKTLFTRCRDFGHDKSPRGLDIFAPQCNTSNRR